MELTILESKILEVHKKELKKFLRLSSERDLYNYTQAAFRLNISRNIFETEFIKSGLLVFIEIRGSRWIAKKDIDVFIESQDRFVHRDSIKR